jgi:hypothetical protein
MLCYCSICRKTSGAVTSNVMGLRATLRVRGKKHLRCHHAVLRRPGQRPTRSRGERWFCGECGSHLYVLDDRWAYGVWPNAAALDTALPVPPERVHLMLRFKPDWVPVEPGGERYPVYPELSIAEWHERHGLTATVRSPKTARRPDRGGRRRRKARSR